MNMRKRLIYSLIGMSVLAIASVGFIACESFLEVDLPKSRMVSGSVYEDEGTATAAVTGMYHQLMNSAFASGAINSVTFIGGLSSDELDLYNEDSPEAKQFYQNEIQIENMDNMAMWSSGYQIIYAANAIIEGVSNSASLSEATKDQLEGEARFVRAFCHFYLVNLYGDVPLIRTTDYRVNRDASRTPAAEVYAAIVNDLVKAKELLSAEYPTGERIRANKAVATAMLARVYLYMKDWVKAEEQASVIILNAQYDVLPDLNQVFLANSKETIWQMPHTSYQVRTNEGVLFNLTNGISLGSPAALSEKIVDLFEEDDLRLANWVGIYKNINDDTLFYALKYKNRNQLTPKEYSMVLRVAEQRLIRAEARANQTGKLTLAITDLNEIRERAGLSPLSEVELPNKDTALSEIEKERARELFTEWGHRWLDLKRTNRADAVLNNKPFWDATDILYPLPRQEMLNAPNLKPQNDGY